MATGRGCQSRRLVAKLLVELFYDNEVNQWGYTVPALMIVGTGCNSREDAQKYAVEAIQDVIESGDEEIEDGEVITFDVRLTPIAEAG